MKTDKKWVVFDIEADGLKPTKIYVLSFIDFQGKSGSIFGPDEMREFFFRYEVYVGHNIRRWDFPEAVCRLLDLQVSKTLPSGAKIVDTLFVSWYLYPERDSHGLESYGEEYGVRKPVILDWDSLSIETYQNRCETDVKINERLWLEGLTKLFKIYGDDESVWRFLGYLDFKAYCAALQEKSRWKFDRKNCEANLKELQEKFDDKFNRLREALPRIPVTVKRTRPKRPRRSDGELSVLGERWEKLLVEQGLPHDYDGVVLETVGSDEGNPKSPQQIKDWLYSLGWVPQTIKYLRDKKTGEMKEIPQVNKEAQKGGGVCDSVKLLYEKEPRLELLDGLGILKHRIGLLNGFLRDASEDDFLTARIAGLTNTLRFKHAEIVNLPKPDRDYALGVRSSLCAPDGFELCGADKSSLEDRLKQHFIFPYDPAYVRDLMRDDYDPHLDLAGLAGALTPVDILAYKNGDKSKKKVRDVYKNGNYACQYGAMPPRLAITCGVSLETAQGVWDAYWKRNWAIREVSAAQTVKEVDGALWLFNPISQFWYSLRSKKDVFSTLVQGSAAYVFDLWVMRILLRREELTGQFHDEIILTVRKGHREEIVAFLQQTIDETNDMLRLNRDLAIGIQFGDRYSEIH
ncbi:MAG: DNA polymerase [Candidatus Obscuribacterales bacterium]